MLLRPRIVRRRGQRPHGLHQRGGTDEPAAGLQAVRPSRISSRARRCLIGLLVQPAAAHEAPGDVGGLEGASLGRRVGGEVARDGDQDMAALVGCAPFLVLAHARLEHLEGVEARVLAQERVGEGGEEVLGPSRR